MKSPLFTLDLRDLINGLFIAFLTAILTGTIELLGKQTTFEWVDIKPILIAGISAALAYLLKSLSTNSRNELFKKEPG
jgi:uncharacterized membrane protein YeiH